jgi:hypothetical protein
MREHPAAMMTVMMLLHRVSASALICVRVLSTLGHVPTLPIRLLASTPTVARPAPAARPVPTLRPPKPLDWDEVW